jgi:hypothetical protein
MAADPEFFIRYVLIAQNLRFFLVVPEDAVKVLHLKSLRIGPADGLFVEDRRRIKVYL